MALLDQMKGSLITLFLISFVLYGLLHAHGISELCSEVLKVINNDLLIHYLSVYRLCYIYTSYGARPLDIKGSTVQASYKEVSTIFPGAHFTIPTIIMTCTWCL